MVQLIGMPIYSEDFRFDENLRIFFYSCVFYYTSICLVATETQNSEKNKILGVLRFSFSVSKTVELSLKLESRM